VGVWARDELQEKRKKCGIKLRVIKVVLTEREIQSPEMEP
jgi:predicted nucleotidyltransferase